MNKFKFVPRGSIQSPILIVGDSLPKNENTIHRLNEILDRRGVTYNSIIVPLKYYMNEYLLYKYNCKLPRENDDDIFRYVNAVDKENDKWGLNPETREGIKILNTLRKEIFNLKAHYRIIICMGDFSYFAVRTIFHKYNKHERKIYPKNKTKYSITQLGTYFMKSIADYNSKDEHPIILPILHNSINLSFDRSKEFIPQNSSKSYVSTMQFIAEQIGEIIVADKKCKEFLVRCQTETKH